MKSDERTILKKSLMVCSVLFGSCLLAICYVHALPPAPLVSIRSHRNDTSVIHIRDSIPIVNITANISSEFKPKLVARKAFTPAYNMTATQLATNLKACVEPNIEDGGPIQPNKSVVDLDIVEMELKRFLHSGGAFEPRDCKAKYHVAIIIPFRDRYGHLSIFLRNIHPFLMKQNIAYRIFVIEQTNGQLFNRAALMNVGFLEALKIYNWDCFIFHDVDLLPLDDRNLYNCPRQPRHMSVALDKFKFRLPYRTIFGGVSAMTRKQFETVNGFSNLYFGWGGEDDDMYHRIKQSGYFISRYPVNIARYTMLHHQSEKANPKRYEHLANTISTFKTEGLNSIRYDVYSVKEFPTFTWCLIELKIEEPKI